MKYEPDLRTLRFTTVLNFELQAEQVFVSGDGGPGQTTQAGAHSGAACLMLPAGTRKVRIDLARIWGPRPFPGPWALAGGYVKLPQAGTIRISYEVDGVGGSVVARRDVAAGTGWTAAFVDIARYYDAGGRKAVPGVIVLEFPESVTGQAMLDDVMLIDNGRVIVPRSADGSGWTIRQRGFGYEIDAMPLWRVSLSGAETDESGWTIRESTALRAVATSKAEGTWAMYPDGRRYVNGQYKPLKAGEWPNDGAYAAQHTAPALLSVAEETGRVNRTSAGDANNDGYNELTGAYQIAASGPRVEVHITPQTPRLLRPVLEISGLGEGRILATMEGELIERAVRLPDGRVLVEIPQAIARPVTVVVRLQ